MTIPCLSVACESLSCPDVTSGIAARPDALAAARQADLQVLVTALVEQVGGA
ncbi:hypothetical protein BaRGS_00029569, partial [Batillaria attramentaria]